MRKIILFSTLLIILVSCSSNSDDGISSGNIESETCLKVKDAVDNAKAIYINSPQNSTEANCKNYLNALKDQQVICGDADGKIQETLDSIKDCTDDT